MADSTTPTREEPIRAWRWAGFAGLTWFGAFIVGAVVLQGEPPAYDKPIPEVRDFFARDGQRYLVGDYIVNIAFVFFFLPLVVGLRSRLGAAEDGAQIGSRLVLVGGLLTVAVGGVAWTPPALNGPPSSGSPRARRWVSSWRLLTPSA